MKTIPSVFVALMAIAVTVRSQDGGQAVSQGEVPGDSAAAPVVLPTVARILGNIPDGTPPPPQPPKPGFIVPNRDIVTTTTHEQGGRTITIQKIQQIALPPPPEPAPVSSVVDNAEFKRRMADYRATHPRPGLISLGATVYRFKDSPPRTLVTYRPDPKEETITFWSSADFALISGIGTFVDTDGNTYGLHLMWTSMDTARIAAMLASHGRQYRAPSIPDFPDGPATYAIVGSLPADESVLVPIQSLHDIYNSEHQRLQTAWDGRERARIEREDYLKAHPPQPKNITLNYWRTERPAAVKGGTK
jgi:hypothetical protein